MNQESSTPSPAPSSQSGGHLYVEQPYAVTALSSIFTICSFAYAVWSRSLDDFIRYPSYAVFVFTPLLTWAAYVEERARRSRVKAAAVALLFAVPLLLMAYLVSAIFYSIGVVIKDGVLWTATTTSSKPFAATIAALVALSIGAFLFWIRLHYRCVYGLSESAVGVFVGVFRVSSETTRAYLEDTGFYVAVLTASVYLIVRGLDNIHQGWVKDPRDPIAAKFVELVKRWATARPTSSDKDDESGDLLITRMWLSPEDRRKRRTIDAQRRYLRETERKLLDGDPAIPKEAQGRADDRSESP